MQSFRLLHLIPPCYICDRNGDCITLGYCVVLINNDYGLNSYSPYMKHSVNMIYSFPTVVLLH